MSDSTYPRDQLYGRHVSLKRSLSAEAVRTDTIGKAERARSLYTAADVLDVGLLVSCKAELLVEPAKVLSGENFKGSDDALAGELLDRLDRPRLGDLHLQRTLAEVEGEHLGDVLLHLRFLDHILTGDAKVDVTLADERGDIGRWKKDAWSL